MILSLIEYADSVYSENGYYKINYGKLITIMLICGICTLIKMTSGSYMNQIVGNGLYLVNVGAGWCFVENALIHTILCSFIGIFCFLIDTYLQIDTLICNIIAIIFMVFSCLCFWARFKKKIIEMKEDLLDRNNLTNTIVAKKGIE